MNIGYKLDFDKKYINICFISVVVPTFIGIYSVPFIACVHQCLENKTRRSTYFLPRVIEKICFFWNGEYNSLEIVTKDNHMFSLEVYLFNFFEGYSNIITLKQNGQT